MRVDKRETIGAPGHLHVLGWNGRKLVCRTCTVLDEPKPQWLDWLKAATLMAAVIGGIVAVAVLAIWGSH